MATLIRNVPYIAALALAIFGVAYQQFLRPHDQRLLGVSGDRDRRLSASSPLGRMRLSRQERFKLIWTQAAHWVDDSGGDEPRAPPRLPAIAAGAGERVWCCCCCSAVGAFLAGIYLLSLRICFLGLAMGLSIPAMTWLKQAALLLLLGRRRDRRTRHRLLAARQEGRGLTAWRLTGSHDRPLGRP